VTDIDDGTKADVELPTPSKAGAIEVGKDANGKAVANGQVAEEEEDDWGKTGWEPRFGWPSEPADEGESMLDHTTLVESQLPEKFFGGKLHVSSKGSVEACTYTFGIQTGTTTQQSFALLASPHGW
jgi:hypothetical protein